MLVQRIVHSINRDTSVLYRLFAAVLALLLAVAFAFVPSGSLAWADEVAGEGELPSGSINETIPSSDEETALQTVYVYIQVTEKAADVEGADENAAEESTERINDHGFYTIGTIQVELPLADVHGTELDIAVYQEALDEALQGIDRFDANKDMDISHVTWTKLAVAQGATDYPDAPALAWHLDGQCEAADDPVVPPAPVDPEPDPEPSPDPEPDPEPTPAPDPEPVPVPDPTPAPETPLPATPNANAGDRPGTAAERPAAQPARPNWPATSAREVEVPASAAKAPIKAPVAPSVADVEQPEVVIDDAAPMAARAGSSIAEEAVPLGAFDEPVDPAPWVAGMGAIGTALYATFAVRRRLLMAQNLKAFENQVLGTGVAPAADSAASPVSFHHVL